MGKDDEQRLLEETLYSYIGYNNVEKINNEIEENNNIKSTKVPKSLDNWFEDYNRKLEERKNRKKYKERFKSIFSKVAIVFLVLFISMSILTVTVDAFRVKLLNIIMNNTEKYLEIGVSDSNGVENIHRNLEGFYELEYIPSGFKIDYVEDLGDTKVVSYVNNRDEEILFNQSPSGTNFQLDSENAEVKEININGNEAVILNKEGRTTLFWNNEEYSFYLISTIGEEELIKMSKSLVKR